MIGADLVSGIEIASFVVGSSIEALGSFLDNLVDNYSDYGASRTILLYTTIPQALSVINRVRQHVICTPRKQRTERDPRTVQLAINQAIAIKKSYDKSLNIIAVAGAIVAQIAITALSLRDVDQINWTVEAAFVISLMAGLLSVYYACLIEVKLGGMHSPDEVSNWLTAHTIPLKADSFGYISPSFNAALILVAPMQLLNWSLFSLLIGIGIYYGLMSERSESAVRGEKSGLAVLLVYVVFTTGATVAYVLPSVLKMLGATGH